MCKMMDKSDYVSHNSFVMKQHLGKSDLVFNSLPRSENIINNGQSTTIFSTDNKIPRNMIQTEAFSNTP